jgi:glutamine amidotransferase
VIEIVDPGLGNIQSLVNMIARAGGESRVARAPEELVERAKVVLPGVGSFDRGITALRDRGFDEALRAAVASGARLLGVCLGMQLLFESSEEGVLPGLGLIAGRVKRFCLEDRRLRVPHMGWNVVRTTRPSQLFAQNAEEQRFYFVHSYYAECANASDVIAMSSYGIDFACAVERDRVLGVQFHPEKSHRYGMELFRRFVEI